jgi:hypothetical protein
VSAYFKRQTTVQRLDLLTQTRFGLFHHLFGISDFLECLSGWMEKVYAL